MRRGATLAELMSVVLIVVLMASIATPTLRRTLDRIAVVGAAQKVAAVHETARQAAIARGTLVRYEFARTAPDLALSAKSPAGEWDTLRIWSLGAVQVSASQRVVTFGPLGIGYGASNTRLVLSRGAAVETLTVSRTGRLRGW